MTAWRLLALLAVSVLINYLDRGALSLAAPAVMADLKMDARQMGLLLSAFFWTYASFQLVAGWMVDRWSVTRLYAWAFLLWTLATLATGFASGFASLLALRLLLGAGEAVAYPAFGRIFSTIFREDQRGFANGAIDAASRFGPALGAVLAGWLIGTHGWRVFFWAIGGATLLWLIPWCWAAPRQLAGEDSTDASGGSAWRALLRRPAVWITCGGLFCFNYGWYFLLTWLPGYLMLERKFTVERMALYNALPLAATAVTSITAGWISDRLIARGWRAARVRSGFLSLGTLVAALALPLVPAASDRAAMALLVAALIGLGCYTSNCWALTQCLAGPRAIGKWTGTQNAIGNLAGVTAPLVTGWLVARTGTFRAAFFCAAAVLAAGAALYRLLPPETAAARDGEAGA